MSYYMTFVSIGVCTIAVIAFVILFSVVDLMSITHSRTTVQHYFRRVKPKMMELPLPSPSLSVSSFLSPSPSSSVSSSSPSSSVSSPSPSSSVSSPSPGLTPALPKDVQKKKKVRITPTPKPIIRSYFQHSKVKFTKINSEQMTGTLTALLARVVLLLDLLDVKYTICHGTLIGWARNKNFLPLDDDIDIRVYYKDWPKLYNIYENATKIGKLWEIRSINANGKQHEIPLLQADHRLEHLDERNDIQFRVIGVGYTNLNKYDDLTKDIHLDLVSSVSVANNFWKDVTPAFRSELLHSQLNGVNVSVTRHYDEILKKAYGQHWRIPVWVPPNVH